MLPLEIANILVVDDDQNALDSLSELLSLEGFEITQARSGQEALELLRCAPAPSLILLDLLMPVMNGFEFLSIKAQDRELASIPVVIISGVTSDVPKNVPLLRKPLNPHNVLQAVRYFSAIATPPN